LSAKQVREHLTSRITPATPNSYSGLDRNITMDFVEELPLSQGHSVILVVVDKLSKYANFTSLSHPYNAAKIAQLFIANVFKLHAMLNSIISDRDPEFTSTF